MKVMIGSIILLVIIGFGLWLMLSPIFKQVGSGAKNSKSHGRKKISMSENKRGNTKKLSAV